jgi:hypothetical protein
MDALYLFIMVLLWLTTLGLAWAINRMGSGT